MLNASNATFYHLSIRTAAGEKVPFHVIGSDGGYLAAPIQLPLNRPEPDKQDLLVAPGERYDVIVDFAPYAGQKLMLSNDANGPYPDGEPVLVPDVMQIAVARRAKGSDSTTPAEDLQLPGVASLTQTGKITL